MIFCGSIPRLLKAGKKVSPHSDGLPRVNALVDVIENTQEFALLEEEWEDLYLNSPLATPFQSWSWLYSWWEFYGEGYELRLITMRNDEGLLIGILPLIVERRRGFRRLLFVGTGVSDYLDALVRDGWEEAVFEPGVQALGQIGSWSVADLQQLRPNAAVWGFSRRWKGNTSYSRQDGCPVVEVKSWDELVGSLSKNLRSTLRRTLRRVEADGIRREMAKPADAEREQSGR
jgi:CelD/BcsL family acetyltransferase involved in cellulose biosynthesis